MDEDFKTALFLFLVGLAGTAVIAYIILAFVILPSTQPFWFSIPAGAVLLCLAGGLPFCLMLIGLCAIIDEIIERIRRYKK